MKVQKRRRRENKTDYLKRIKLLKSKTPRIVFRKTNKYILSQYVTSKNAQDKIEINVSSKKLLSYGWPEKSKGSLKSTPAAYLTGYLIGKQIIKEKKTIPIIDFGMIRALHKTKIYAFNKGLIDSGLKVKTSEKVFPEENRIKGEHLKKKIPFEEIKLKIDKI